VPDDDLTRHFLAAIDANPRDTSLWLILADHLADLGEPEAEGWRWLVAKERSPRLYSLITGWSWYDVEERELADSDDLPGCVWDLLSSKKSPWPRSSDYPTCSAALADAARAVVRWKRGAAAR
jgi:uncharacterized protein (TIGR02996 family)